MATITVNGTVTLSITQPNTVVQNMTFINRALGGTEIQEMFNNLYASVTIPHFLPIPFSPLLGVMGRNENENYENYRW